MENIFFSGTFGGELLSLAAANIVLSMHLRDEVSPKLVKYGENLSKELERVISETEMSSFLEIKGHSTWKFLNWKEVNEHSIPELKTFFMQEMFRRGVLILGTHNVSLSHATAIQRSVIRVYEEVLSKMAININQGTLRAKLEVEPLQPLFKVR
jgi:4-aminobutyrate aminotransferase-like enzyme